MKKDYNDYMQSITADEKLKAKITAQAVQNQELQVQSHRASFAPVFALAASLTLILGIGAVAVLWGDDDAHPPLRPENTTAPEVSVIREGKDTAYSAESRASFTGVVTDMGSGIHFMIVNVENNGSVQVMLDGVPVVCDYGFIVIGDTVEVIFDGVMLDSYPAQTGEVYEVRVLKKGFVEDASPNHTDAELSGEQRIYFNVLKEHGFPIAGAYVRQSDRRIIFEFIRDNEEMEELRGEIEEVIAAAIEQTLINSAGKYKAPDMDMFRFIGSGEAVRIPVTAPFRHSNAPNMSIVNVTPTELTFEIVNATKDSWWTGDDYSLYVREGEDWRLLNTGLDYNDEAVDIPPGETYSEVVSWEWYRGELSQGEYMLEKRVNFSDGVIVMQSILQNRFEITARVE